MQKYALTLIGLSLALTVFSVSILFDIESFETVLEALEAFERYELDEIIIPLFILLFFTILDQNRRQHLHKTEQEKIKIYKAMMFSTHHILNNFLNNMQLFKMTAENTSDFDPEILSLYDVVIDDASAQIEALGNITAIDEGSIHASVTPK